MKAIQPEIIDKLTKILGMTGSNFDGEKLAAVNRANELLKANKLTWPEIMASRTTVKYIVSAESTAQQSTSWLSKIEQIKRIWPELSDWEKNFVQSVAERVGNGRPLTQKQEVILIRLFVRSGG
ncbi:MAG: hypothetical protein HQK56_06545 [Deltaproteobacteria bacterium]|nr:hypothetical protein [Deltaproteobacteria bacterium]